MNKIQAAAFAKIEKALKGVNTSKLTVREITELTPCLEATVWKYLIKTGKSYYNLKDGKKNDEFVRIEKKLRNVDTTTMNVLEIAKFIRCTRQQTYWYLRKLNKPFRRQTREIEKQLSELQTENMTLLEICKALNRTQFSVRYYLKKTGRKFERGRGNRQDIISEGM